MDIKKLTVCFQKQVTFATDYSPFYARLFGIVAAWLEKGEGDLIVDWLLAAANGRSPFNIPLLLLAGVHRDVLMGVPTSAGLAQYYPTVGGAADFMDEEELDIILKTAVLSRQESLAHFIQTATVQTNETGRGLVWLLPLLNNIFSLSDECEGIHLVDLGASAGLNLVAEQRAYRLVDKDNQLIADLGNGNPIQFTTICEKWENLPLAPTFGRPCPLPPILSRTGCDVAPFGLQTAVSEQTLAAYIWADQPHRVTRLREGIVAFQQINQTESPIQIHQATLPDALPRFLQKIPTFGGAIAPVVIYNTYMTAYLPNKGQGLRSHIADWATNQNRPILWLQWEPAWGNGGDSPEYGWCAWTADLWQGGNHIQHQIGWVHPHGTEAVFI